MIDPFLYPFDFELFPKKSVEERQNVYKRG